MVYLPKVDEEANTSLSGDRHVDYPTGYETVLMVEDDQMVRKVVSLLLNNQGYTVLEAANGVDALRLVQDSGQRRIDLLLTDMVMPLMGGGHLSERIKEVHPEIKVIFISGYIDDSVARHVVSEEGVEFIQKPFMPDELARRVRQVLDK